LCRAIGGTRNGGNKVDGPADPLADGQDGTGDWREQRDWLPGGAGVGAAWGARASGMSFEELIVDAVNETFVERTCAQE
jgi:hypothetical protein